MWWVEPPGASRIVIGVYDHPADEDVPFLKSRSVGSSWPADVARKLTGAIDAAGDLLDKLDGPF